MEDEDIEEIQAYRAGVDKLPGRSELRSCIDLLKLMAPSAAWTAAIDELVANEVITVENVQESLTWSQLKELTRDHLSVKELKVLGRLLDPTCLTGFIWKTNPKADESIPDKRRPGGNGNCKPVITLEAQLKDTGVEALDPSTFRFNPDVVYDGIPRKGQANYIDDHKGRLFRNLWLTQQQVGNTLLPQVAPPG